MKCDEMFNTSLGCKGVISIILIHRCTILNIHILQVVKDITQFTIYDTELCM